MQRNSGCLCAMATRTLIVKSPWRFFKRTRKTERRFPWVFATLLGLIAIVCIHAFSFTVTQHTLVRALGSSVIFGSIAAGFIGTSLAVLTGINRKFKSQLIRSEYINDFRDYLKRGLYSGFVLALVGILGPIAVENQIHNTTVVVWVFSLSYCIAALYRACRLMFVIFTDPDTH